MKIIRLTTEYLERDCVTDEARPRVSFAIESEREGARLERAILTVGDWTAETKEQILIPYGGAPLKPFTKYTVSVTATDNFGEQDTASMQFETGRMDTPWQGKWITDGSYSFTEKKISPRPMTFRKSFTLKKPVRSARLYGTAMGIAEFTLNGRRVGDSYFAPGFTSYQNYLQYRTYDVTALLKEENVLYAEVAGGWAVGSFVFTRKNRISADRQALLSELRIEYTDGTSETVGTDETFSVTRDGALRFSDLYDGEVYDGTVDFETLAWRPASAEKIRYNPEITAEYGAPVRVFREMTPLSCDERNGELVYDFGQNFAGVICAEIDGMSRGQTVEFRHAELLKDDGSLDLGLLRSAKATAIYIAREGRQVYSPRFTYMGFRYVGVKGIEKGRIKLKAFALSSDIAEAGSFSCSDDRINRLQSNLLWSARSNFMDIPTDCPQRDERMGWTGDIAVFAPTACFNFDMGRFLEKWLRDLRAEQLKTGGIPNTVPVQGYGFPATMPKMAVDFWGDACILVPWAEYCARGDKALLERSYDSMKRYVNACKFWAGLLSVGKRRYIWHTPSMLHFGDWIAPDVKKMSGWQKRSKWTATASLAHTSKLLSVIASLLGKKDDAQKYEKLSRKTAEAYCAVFTDGKGKLKKEFQTGYVLPLYFGMFPEEARRAAAKNLAALVKKNGYKIATGFPGTPYILFALADNGEEETAFRMLMNTDCPSWLYEVKAGGTTVWERWDGLKEDGTLNAGKDDGTGGMVSFNHYASGAVGDFLYRRIAGIEPVECGYRTFRIKPLAGGGIVSAEGRVNSPYGKIESKWRVEDGSFSLEVRIPAGTACEIVLPDGSVYKKESGTYRFGCRMA